MRHLVQKQVFEVSAPSLRLAQRWERRAPDLLRAVITPCIERCFDEARFGEAELLIDRIEVDLGVLHERLSEQQIRERVEGAVMQALRTYAVASAADPVPPAAPSDRPAPGSRRLEGPAAVFECFVHFLVHGRLPWWAEAGGLEPHGEWVAQATARQLAEIARVLVHWEHARERLALQFEADFIAGLLRRYRPHLADGFRAGWNWLDRVARGSPAAAAKLPPLRRAYWIHAIGRCVGSGAEPAGLLRPLRDWLRAAPEARAQASALLSGGNSGGLDAAAFEVLPPLLAAALAGRTDRDRAPGAPPGGERGQDDGPTLRQDSPPSRTSGADTLPDAASSGAAAHPPAGGSELRSTYEHADREPSVPSDTDATTLYVEAAGLVLLHPFLAELFRSGRLWDERGWTSTAARHQAVLLVAWLAHGDSGLPEYRLLMPKLLCGMPWEETLDPTPLQAHHLEAGAELLEAVVGHWKVLGRTSIDGLREGFVLRDGRLSARRDGWALVVERKAQDILLGRLPWGISVVRLPWLRPVLVHVDWA